jgi:hypothetical protein
MRAFTSRGRRSTPVPRHVEHGSVMIDPLPWQFRHGEENENRPWLSSTTPRPPQTPQTCGWVPGLLPDPAQVEHWASLVRYSVVVSPVAASAKSRLSCGGDVGASARADAATGAPATASPPEHLSEQVADVASLHVADVERESSRSTTAAAAGHRAESAHLVVLGALGLVAEHVVRR